VDVAVGKDEEEEVVLEYNWDDRIENDLVVVVVGIVNAEGFPVLFVPVNTITTNSVATINDGITIEIFSVMCFNYVVTVVSLL